MLSGNGGSASSFQDQPQNKEEEDQRANVINNNLAVFYSYSMIKAGV